MTQRDPRKRLAVRDYFSSLLLFPAYFDSCLYPLYLKMHWMGSTPDARVDIVCDNYNEWVKALTGLGSDNNNNNDNNNNSNNSNNSNNNNKNNNNNDDPGREVFARKQIIVNNTNHCKATTTTTKTTTTDLFKKLQSARCVPTTTTKTTTTELSPDQLSLEELLLLAKKVLAEVEDETTTTTTADSDSVIIEEERDASFFNWSPEKKQQQHSVDNNNNSNNNNNNNNCEGLVFIISMISTVFRHLRFPQSKMLSIMMLSRIGVLLLSSSNSSSSNNNNNSNNEVVLQRVVPVLILAIEDQCGAVRALAVRALSEVLRDCQGVMSANMAEASLFPLFVFPPIGRLTRDPEAIVRVAFAESLGKIAVTAKRFLNNNHFMAVAASAANANVAGTDNNNNSNNNNNSIDFPFESKLEALKDTVSKWIRDLVMEQHFQQQQYHSVSSNNNNNSNNNNTSSLIKQIILNDIQRLCVFFGQESTIDKLLTQLLTFLNDQV